MSKPPFRVPSMAELLTLAPGPYSAASLFAGGGGSSLGYRMAGYRMAYANEVVPEARAAYQANAAPYTVLDGSDVRKVSGATILDAVEALTGERELHVLDGSPPCQPFSKAGIKHKGWERVQKHADGTEQVSVDLFHEYARLVGEVRPQVFVAENVAGMIRGVSVGIFHNVLADLRSQGYVVDARLLDARWLGVPQARPRLIFVGVRDDLALRGLTPAYPRPLPYSYSIREALHGLPPVGDDGLDPEKGVRVALAHNAVGTEWDLLKPGRKSKRYQSLERPHWDAPCPTLLATNRRPGIAGVTHPQERRKFTLAEARRLCSFPDDYLLPGDYQDGWARLGNAVPPVMMRHVATAVREQLLDRIAA